MADVNPESSSAGSRKPGSKGKLPLYDFNERTQRRILDSRPRIISSEKGVPIDVPAGYNGGDSWAANKGVKGKFHPSKLPPFLHKYMFPTSFPFKSQGEAQKVANRVMVMRRWGAPILAFAFIFFPYQGVFGRDSRVLDTIDLTGVTLEDDGED